MNLFQAAIYLLGAVAYIGAIVGAVAVVTVPRFSNRDSAFFLAVFALVGGWLVASIVTPDWNPLSMLAAYAPFFAIGVWMAFVSARRSRRSVNR